jgi:hypothetical protein
MLGCSEKLNRAATSGIILILFFSFITCASAAEFTYPLDQSITWIYKSVEKATGLTFTAEASIISRETVEGREYLFFSAPSVNIRFLVRGDESGVYMKVIKYPYPLLNFASYDIYVQPELLFIKYPMAAGEKWEQELDARAVIFGMFTFERKIKVYFENKGIEKVLLDGVELEAWHIVMLRDEGEGSIKKEESWYVDKLGYVKGETETNYIDIMKVIHSD